MRLLLSGAVGSQPLLNAFRDCGSEIDVRRAVEVRIGCTGLAAESRQVLIGVKHSSLAVANNVADRLDGALGSLSPIQSKSAHPSALAAPDKITGGTPRRARPATDRAAEPRPTH